MSTSNAIGGLMGATSTPAAGGTTPPAANDASGGDSQFAGLLGASPSPSPGAAPPTQPGPTAGSDATDTELPAVELDEAAALLVWLPWMTPPAAGAPGEGAATVPANGAPGSAPAAAELTLRAGTLPGALASGPAGANAAALQDGIASTAAAMLAAQSAGGDSRNTPISTSTSLSPSALAAALVPVEPSAAIPVGLPLAASADATAASTAAAAGAAAQLKTLAADIVEAMAGERGGESGDSRPDARLSSLTSLRDGPQGPRTGFELNLGGGAQRFADTLADGVEQRMQWMAERGIGRAQIRLTPAELGVIDIDLQLDGKHVRAEFSSANADVRQVLESQLPRLREMFLSQGMTLTQADVGHRQDAQSGAESGQRREDEGFAGHAGFDAADDETVTTRIVGQRLPNGMLDEYA